MSVVNYRPDIDGLRALAVLAVIAYHAGMEVVPGGFLGVDVFFVISGFLITSILTTDLNSGRFSLRRFYERRARRILPALLVVLMTCLPFAWYLMTPAQMSQFAESLLAVIAFGSNVYFWRQHDYFASNTAELPLLHTWSLAVEEQFYLVFPLLLLVLLPRSAKRAQWAVLLLAMASLGLSEWGWRYSAVANFYLAPTRCWQLLAGALCAFMVFERGQRPNDWLALLGLAAVMTAIFGFDATMPLPSAYSLVPVLGVVLIILCAGPDTLVARLLGHRVLVGVGLVSYSAYLWHQPLFAFAHIVTLGEPPAGLMAGLCAVTLVMAYLSWKYIETPLRRYDHYRQPFFVGTAALTMLLLVGGVAGVCSDGFENATAHRRAIKHLDTRFAANVGMSEHCDKVFTLTDNCANSTAPSLLIWGDSLAMHLYQGIVASHSSVALRQHTKSSCSPVMGVAPFGVELGMDRGFAQRCIDFNQQVFDWLAATPSVQWVVLSSPFGWVANSALLTSEGDVLTSDFHQAVDQLKATIERIRGLGVAVVLVSPTPRSGEDIGQCLIKRYRFGGDDCDFPYSEALYAHRFLSAMEAHVGVYWLHEDLCIDGLCQAAVEDIPLFRDSLHLTMEGSEYLGRTHGWYERMRSLAL